MRNVKYRLWAMPITDESIVFATEQEFSRIGDGRVLAYLKDKDAPEIPAFEIGNDGDLTENELRWLTRCNIEILERTTKNYAVPMEKAMPLFLKRLNKELESIRRTKDAEEKEFADQ